MIAGKEIFPAKVEFDNDYGVDIGLLIDMHNVNARITEVCIGEVENDRHPLHVLAGCPNRLPMHFQAGKHL